MPDQQLRQPSSGPRVKQDPPPEQNGDANLPTASTSLVNENAENQQKGPSAEELKRSLEDSRSEVVRVNKNIDALKADLARSNDTVEKLTARLVELQKKPSEAAAPGKVAPPSSLIPQEDYVGPSQTEIYLQLVAGCAASMNLLKVSDKDIGDLASSLPGISEVFYHRCIRRQSFAKPQ